MCLQRHEPPNHQGTGHSDLSHIQRLCGREGYRARGEHKSGLQNYANGITWKFY
jgi:hypothetical protein